MASLEEGNEFSNILPSHIHLTYGLITGVSFCGSDLIKGGLLYVQFKYNLIKIRPLIAPDYVAHA